MYMKLITTNVNSKFVLLFLEKKIILLKKRNRKQHIHLIRIVGFLRKRIVFILICVF